VAAGVSAAALDWYRPTWATIDLDRLAANLAIITQRIGRRPILAVVKANAYGHGAAEIARALEREGVSFFGVALPEEGVELRASGIRSPILLLGGATPSQADMVLAHDLTPAVYRRDQIDALGAAAARRGTRIGVHLKVDTGMGRLGVPGAEVQAFAALLAAAPHLRVDGIFSHLAVADAPSDPFTRLQIDQFQNAVQALRAHGLNPAHVHLANSAAIMDHPPAWMTLVRPGIVLYGYPPSKDVTPLAVRPVLSLSSRIIYIKDVPAGASCGYGRTWQAPRPSRIASLAIGYDDGLPRLAGNRGAVLVRGRRVPIVGRVSMDLTTVDVTDIPAAALGDEAVIIGRSDDAEIGAPEIAAWAETITWEILCGVGARVPRLYRRGDEQFVVSRFAPGMA